MLERLGAVQNQGWAVAEVVKAFGNSSDAETFDEIRYPTISLS